MNLFVEIIGFAAGVLTTASFAPQALKAWRTRATRDLSLTMYVMLATGVFLWLVYGLAIGSAPVIWANAVTLVLVLSVLLLKLRYR